MSKCHASRKCSTKKKDTILPPRDFIIELLGQITNRAAMKSDKSPETGPHGKGGLGWQGGSWGRSYLSYDLGEEEDQAAAAW